MVQIGRDFNKSVVLATDKGKDGDKVASTLLFMLIILLFLLPILLFSLRILLLLLPILLFFSRISLLLLRITVDFNRIKSKNINVFLVSKI